MPGLLGLGEGYPAGLELPELRHRDVGGQPHQQIDEVDRGGEADVRQRCGSGVPRYEDVRPPKGCRVCKGRRARSLAAQLNILMRKRDVNGARALISRDTEAAPLAVVYTKEEYRHMLETILSQEYGIEMRPTRAEEGVGAKEG